MPRKGLAASERHSDDRRGLAKKSMRYHAPARSGSNPTSPPILKGNRVGQRRFHDLFDSAPWLTPADATLVGLLVWAELKLVELTGEMTSVTTSSPNGREFQSPHFRSIMDLTNQIQSLSERLALDVSSRARLGLREAQASSLLESIRSRRIIEAATTEVPSE